MLHNIYCYRSAIAALLRHLQSYPRPSLHYLCVWCDYDSDVRALTTFLPLCTNLLTLHCERGYNSRVSESVDEEMWEAAVRRCRNLEVVRVDGGDSAASCKRLVSVLKRLSEKEGIQALKLKKVVQIDGGQEEYYTEQVKHLLPALQQ